MNNKISNVLKSELINTAEMLVVFYALENDNVRSLTSEKPNIAYLVVDVLYFHSPELNVYTYTHFTYAVVKYDIIHAVTKYSLTSTVAFYDVKEAEYSNRFET